MPKINISQLCEKYAQELGHPLDSWEARMTAVAERQLKYDDALILTEIASDLADAVIAERLDYDQKMLVPCWRSVIYSLINTCYDGMGRTPEGFETDQYKALVQLGRVADESDVEVASVTVGSVILEPLPDSRHEQDADPWLLPALDLFDRAEKYGAARRLLSTKEIGEASKHVSRAALALASFEQQHPTDDRGWAERRKFTDAIGFKVLAAARSFAHCQLDAGPLHVQESFFAELLRQSQIWFELREVARECKP